MNVKSTHVVQNYVNHNYDERVFIIACNYEENICLTWSHSNLIQNVSRIHVENLVSYSCESLALDHSHPLTSWWCGLIQTCSWHVCLQRHCCWSWDITWTYQHHQTSYIYLPWETKWAKKSAHADAWGSAEVASTAVCV